MPFGTISGWVEDGTEAAGNFVSDTTEPVRSTWDGFATTTTDHFSDLYGGAGSVAGGFGDTVSDGWDTATDTVSDGTEAVSDGASGLWDGFTSGLETVVDGAKETAGAPGRAMDRMTMLVLLGIAAVVLVAVME